MEQQESKAKVSRRKVMIAGGGAAIAGLGVVALTPLGNPVKSRAREMLASNSLGRSMLSLSDGTLAEWQAQVGSTFAIGGGTTMRLAAAHDGTDRRAGFVGRSPARRTPVRPTCPPCPPLA